MFRAGSASPLRTRCGERCRLRKTCAGSGDDERRASGPVGREAMGRAERPGNPEAVGDL